MGKQSWSGQIDFVGLWWNGVDGGGVTAFKPSKSASGILLMLKKVTGFGECH